MSDTRLFSTTALARLLAEHWGLPTAETAEHDGGMSSLTWVVTQGRQRWLAKAVSATTYGQQFTAGLTAAARLSKAGIPASDPAPTLEGTLSVESDGAVLALLSWVEGDPVEQHTIEGMRLVGRTLARAHIALGTTQAQTDIEPRLDPTKPHLWIRPWIRPALAGARAAIEALGLDTLSWGPLHGDPAAEAFLADPATGTVGLIDWGAYTVGPRIFDLASAVMYAGGIDNAQPLIDAYLAEEAVSAAEVERALGAMLGWRWASQAYYFAHRIATGEMTGITDPAENEKGLADAKSYLDPARIRAYQPADEAEWVLSRAVSFLDTCYYDAIEPRKPVVEADSVIDLVAVDEGRIVGILDVALRGELATIETVCVHPGHRRYGIATPSQAVTNDYDAFAEAYAAETESNLLNGYYVRPAVLDLAGDVDGRRILDVGCGAGPLLESLRDRGAVVTGVDPSSKMLELARQRLGEGVALHLGALGGDPLPFPDGAFDDAIACLVLHYLQDWEAPLAELRRLLVPGGRLIAVVNHPFCYKLQYPDAEYFAPREYSEEYTFNGQQASLTYWHRPLHAMSDAFTEAGFRISAISEPPAAPGAPERFPEIWAEFFKSDPAKTRFLSFLFFVLEAL